MNAATTPIAATMSLSILLHGAVIAAVLYAGEQVVVQQAVGKGVSIELISATEAAEQAETDRPKKYLSESSEQLEAVEDEVFENIGPGTDVNRKPSSSERLVPMKNSELLVPNIKELENLVTASVQESPGSQRKEEQRLVSVFDNNSQMVTARSTDASQQRHTILELLHSSISNKKVYPYIARRQRKEGTSTITFTLYPDGRVEEAQLLSSSQAIMLDRAAISAVQDIEPFIAAQRYLEHAEKFEVDVVFSLH